jgi:uncharacterized protein involved in outer membrane biogenesis
MKKILSIIGVIILVLIIALVLFLGQIIKTAVETVGPQVAGVPVTLEKAGINLLSGNVTLKGLVIGNPEGYNTPSAMELGHFAVDLKMASLFTDTIVIKKIHITGPQITYEKGLKDSNLSRLQNNLAPAEAEKPAEEKPAPEKKKGPGKKVIIEDFLFDDAKIHVTLTALAGKKLTLPLPPIHLQDIGKASAGASISEVVNKVLGAVIGAVTDAVASSGDLAGDALKGAGGAATDAAKGATDAAKGAADSIKKGIGGLLGK